MTYSIVARDPETGDLGGAVQSKFLGVGAVVLHGRAGVGMVATQAWANVAYGPRGLALLGAGATARQALEVLVGADEQPGQRQAAVVDAAGAVAAHTGGDCPDWADPLQARGIPCGFAAYLVERDGQWQHVERGIPHRRERICSVA